MSLPSDLAPLLAEAGVDVDAARHLALPDPDTASAALAAAEDHAENRHGGETS